MEAREREERESLPLSRIVYGAGEEVGKERQWEGHRLEPHSPAWISTGPGSRTPATIAMVRT